MFKQIIPCIEKAYVDITYKDGFKEHRPILAFAFYFEDEDDLEPEFWPLTFDPKKGLEDLRPDLLDNVVKVEYGCHGYYTTSNEEVESDV